MEKEVKILAIESSCDETSAAVVVNGREVLSNVIYSQIDIHTLYGGVVPEIASRKHIEKITQVIRQALKEAGCTLDDIDAVAVTYGPGLVGALLVGCFCKEYTFGRSASYRRAYCGKLYREQGSGATVYVPCSVRRTYTSRKGSGLWKVRDFGSN